MPVVTAQDISRDVDGRSGLLAEPHDALIGIDPRSHQVDTIAGCGRRHAIRGEQPLDGPALIASWWSDVGW